MLRIDSYLTQRGILLLRILLLRTFWLAERGPDSAIPLPSLIGERAHRSGHDHRNHYM